MYHAESYSLARQTHLDFVFRQADGLSLSSRLLRRYKRGARLVTLSLDIKDEPDFGLADLVAINSQDLLIEGVGADAGSAVRADVQFLDDQLAEHRLAACGAAHPESAGDRVGR